MFAVVRRVKIVIHLLRFWIIHMYTMLCKSTYAFGAVSVYVVVSVETQTLKAAWKVVTGLRTSTV